MKEAVKTINEREPASYYQKINFEVEGIFMDKMGQKAE